MDQNRFRNIKTLQDIKLEKAKIRYEMLVAENRISENIAGFQELSSLSSFFSRFKYGFRIAQMVFEKFNTYSDKLMFWRKKKKKHKKGEEEESDD